MTKDELQIQLDAMIQRYSQVTNPDEHDERIYL